MDTSVYRVLKPYKTTGADSRIRRRIKDERGHVCEACGNGSKSTQLSIHHILEARQFPEYARDPLNMLVLCSVCHSTVTQAEGFATSVLMHFYARLPEKVRARHLPYLQQNRDASDNLKLAFRSGNHDYWNSRAVDDLTR